MLNSSARFSENSSPRQPDRILDPEDAHKMWIVREGCVDLFFQHMVDGEYGARRHIARIATGQALFGISMQGHSGVSLMAALHPGTEIECTSLPVFRRKDTLSDTHAPVRLLEPWIQTLFAACNLGPAPREAKSVSIESCPILHAEGEDVSIVAAASLVWLRVDARGALLFGEKPLGASCILPISRQGQGWIRLPRDGVVTVTEFDLIDFEDPGWTWLKHFHRVIVECLLEKQERDEHVWADSVRHQQQNDSLTLHRALLRLTAPLSDNHRSLDPPTVGSDPLLTACQAIGKHLGVVFGSVPDGRPCASIRHAVETLARASGVRHRGVTLVPGWWKEDCGPLLAFRKEDQRPLALLPRRRGYDAFDPVEGTSIRLDEDKASQLSAAAYCFYRNFAQRAIGAGALLRFGLGASRNDLLLVIAMGGMAGLLSLVFPISVGIIFDEVIPGADHPHLYGLAALLLAAAIASMLFSLVRSLAILRIEARVDLSAQAAMWDRLLRLPAPFFRKFSSGDLAIRSLAMNQIRALLTNSTMSSLLAGFFSVFSLALLFFYSWSLALLALALTAFALALTVASAFAQLRSTRETARLRGRISATLLQFINGISKLRVSGAERRAFAIWAQEFSQQKSYYMQSRKIANAMVVFQSVFPLIAIAILFLFSDIGPTTSKGLSTGAFLAFLAAFLQFIFYFMQCTSAVPTILSIVPIYERALPILQTLPEVDERRSFPGEVQGAIEVSHLSFRYEPGSPLIVRDVSFAIRPGEFVAFTGPSGSGKSTLLRLLLGFEIPEAGTISYDNQDIAGIDVQALRRQLGVVLQSGRLVSGTILDNIIGSLPLNHDDAWEAARMAGLDGDIRAMPMALHTFVNDGGGGLSGGQRQRLMIARAIVNKPRILLFDEATSALDNHTQSVVSRSLESLRATRVVIAHRLSSIQNADRIYVLDRGRVVQYGTYNELYSQPGLFRGLAQRQVV